ncbi:hypothetical protein C8R44DRAFT_824223 [Mycena epipterygia]|nr:hypothetical protein C8R44DRAFT_824223 [Mycena epipterygia]
MEASGSLRLPNAQQPHTQPGFHAVPPMNRRHSANLTPRPLRSSPLAGPALSSRDEPLETNPQPRIASAPSSRSPSFLSLHSLDFAAENSSRPSTASRRASKVSFVEPAIHPSLSPNPNDYTSFGVDGSPKPLEKRRSVSQPVPILNVRNEDHESVALYPRESVSPPPTRPGSLASLRSEPDENWLTSTPYDTTPRFSRLSLAAPGVVMPVRKGRRRPGSADSGSVKSLGSVPSLSSSVSSPAESLRPSTPNLVFTPPLHGSTKVYEEDIPELGKERTGAHRKRKITNVSRVERGGILGKLWRKLSRRGR